MGTSGFAIGLVIGLALGFAVGRRPQKTWSELTSGEKIAIALGVVVLVVLVVLTATGVVLLGGR